MMTTLNNRVSALFADPLHALFSELQCPTRRQPESQPQKIAINRGTNTDTKRLDKTAA